MRRALLVAGLMTLLSAAPARADLPWAPCTDAGFQAFQCARLPVPLDRSGAVPGEVPLFVRRLKPEAAPAAPTPTAIVALAGGPGQAAAPLARQFAIALASGLRDRDLIVFDQRGTGQSDPLRCAPRDTARGCADRLGPRRGLYRTLDSIQDIEALRAAAGYERITLFGVSYGTKVALDYAARYPNRVERLVLDSVVPPEGQDALLRPSLAATSRVLTELCSAVCGPSIGNPVASLTKLARRSIAARGTYVDGRGRKRRASLRGSQLYPLIRAGDLNPVLRAQVPAALRAAERRDPAPLLRLAVRVYGAPGAQAPGDAGSSAVLLATNCEEARFPWAREAPPAERVRQAGDALRALTPAELGPFTPATIASFGLLRLCQSWPNATPAPAAPGPLPDVPALVLSGRADLRTPTEDAENVALRFPRPAGVVSIPDAGHSVTGSDTTGCVGAAIAGFFSDSGVPPCVAPRRLIAPTPLPPRSVAALGRTGRVAGLRGRTLTALLRTADDAVLQAAGARIGDGPSRLGGLRGGVIIRRGRTLLLRRVEYVPGVRVSGTIPGEGAVQLTVSGRRVARGSIRITSSALTGRLGGRRVSLRRRPQAFAARVGDGRRDVFGLPQLVPRDDLLQQP